jgi:asparagine synthase (glutamine-hydrolysing)
VCGITGYFFPGGPRREDELRRMTGELTHRGPDDHGIHLGDGVGLGHRRLSIIDLSAAGRQPMGNEDGRILAVFNGEIYNFVELRGELESRGHVFRTATDTEVIPHAYEEWGDAFPSHLRGMFAIGLWDDAARRLLLVRDRLGIKPLHYWQGPGQLIFASELNAFRHWPEFTRLVDREALYHYLSFGYVPAPMAIYEGARKLPAAHLLVCEGGNVRISRWWDPLDSGLAPPLDEPEGALLDRLDAALTDAVRCRLVSDVPLGAFLSGGIDSSLVVSVMSALAGGRVRTFTIGFGDAAYDESAWARGVAGRLGADHTELRLAAADALAIIPRLPEIYDEPFGDASAIPTVLVSALARKSVTVALSGDGGDELFCGYPRYRRFDRFRRLLALPLGVRRAAAPLVARLPHPKAAKAARWLLETDPLEFYFGVVGLWGRGLRSEIMGIDRSWDGLDFGRVWNATAALHPLERLMLVDLSTYLPEDILTKVDRASMHHSLEARVPLLDHHLVELALRIPLRHKRRGGGKYLLKRLLGRYLPKELYERPKMGFGVPLGNWFRSDLKEMLLDYTEPARLRREGFFKPEPIRAKVREHLAGEADHQYLLWTLLMFELWLERHR